MIVLQVMITILMQILALIYLRIQSEKQKKTLIGWGLSAGSIALTIIISWYLYCVTTDWLSFTRYLTLYQLLFCIAVMDYHFRIIPNSVLFVGLVLQSVLTICGGFFQKTNCMNLFWANICSCMTSIVLLFLIYVLSKHAIGLGDVKLFGMIGFYLQICDTFSVLFLGVVIAAFLAVFMLLAKKCQKESTLPLAPFILAGYIGTLFTKYF